MVIRAASLAVALSLQEASDALSSNEMRDKLSDAVRKAHSGTGRYASYVDHTGDEDSGDVIFQATDYNGGGDSSSSYVKAPYSKGTDLSDDEYGVDTGKGTPVALRSSWEELPDERDHYAAMQESYVTKGKLYTSLPLYERFVSKKERDAAGSGDFAGKGKSFPILKAADVSAAASSIGRAGSGNYSTDVIKRNIIRIAKAKGWASELPKAWQDGRDEKKESARGIQSGTLTLVESSPFAADITIREAMAPGKRIKLIAPGKGSSAYYTTEALKKAAADNIFKAGTPMRIDHPTDAEEAARPEGSVKDWGAVLSENAVWREDLPTGPGLYAAIKPFSDHAGIISEKGPYAGVSIRANGNAVTESGKPVMREGVPLLKEFTSAEGVDMVTRAGAGGMFLSEAARTAREGDDEMNAAELTALKESNARLLMRALRADARDEAVKILKPMTLAESAKQLVIDHVIEAGVPEKDGELDTAKLKESLEAEAKRVGEAFSAALGGRTVTGMGAPAPTPIDAKEAERREADAKKLRESMVKSFMDMGLPQAAAEKAADREAA